MGAFMADLRARDAIAARALEFLILTNVRTDAVLKAAWDEFDLDQALWTVPLANLKDRKHRKEGFRAPLVARAVEIVEQMHQGRVSRFVFPGPYNTDASEDRLSWSIMVDAVLSARAKPKKAKPSQDNPQPFDTKRWEGGPGDGIPF
jgi:integrase